MTQTLAKLEVENKEIVEQNSDLNSDSFANPYYEKCKIEIKEMQKIKTSDELSNFDILISSDEKLVSYLGNAMVMQALSRKEYRQFSLYTRVFKPCFERAMKRKLGSEHNLEFSNNALEKLDSDEEEDVKYSDEEPE